MSQMVMGPTAKDGVLELRPWSCKCMRVYSPAQTDRKAYMSEISQFLNTENMTLVPVFINTFSWFLA